MPTILYVFGWRIFFYPNEGNEPIHVHCENGDKEAKYWLDVEKFDITEAYGYHLSSRDKRIVRKIIFQNFDQIVQTWENWHGRKKSKEGEEEHHENP